MKNCTGGQVPVFPTRQLIQIQNKVFLFQAHMLRMNKFTGRLDITKADFLIFQES